MAFGDVLKTADSGSYGTTLSFGAPVSAGNTIIVISTCIDGNGGNVTGVSDSLNGAYTEIAVSGTFATDTSVAKMYMFPNTAAGSPTITLNSNPIRSQAFEVQGVLSAGASVGTGFGTGTAVTSTSLPIPANSVSFAAVTDSGAQALSTPAPWNGVSEIGPSNFEKRVDATATTDSFSGTFNTAPPDGWAVAWLSFTDQNAGPSISTVPATAFPGQSRTITGTGFGATQGAGGVTIGGVAQTDIVWSDTSITFTTVLGNNSYGTGKTLEVTTDAATTASDTIELVANTAGGFGVVTMSSPNTTDSSSVAFNTTPTVVTGDQFEWEDFNSLGNLTIDAQGFVSNVDTTGTFRGRFWDATDSTWGAVQEFTAQTEDLTAPTVSNVGVPTAGSYKAGDTLSFTVNFSEVVTVTGTPQLPINIGGVTRQADYASGAGTSALVFSYTVQAGESDADGIGVGTAIGLNGGTIVDQATTPNAANLTLNSVGSTAGVLVDTVKPVITPPSPNPLNIVVGGTFTNDPATATDNQDGSLGTVAGVHTVDTNTIGQYTVTYPGAGVVDSAGNVADDATRTVNVVAELPEPSSRKLTRSLIRSLAGKSLRRTL